jgi:hypothetical protein
VDRFSYNREEEKKRGRKKKRRDRSGDWSLENKKTGLMAC